MNPFDVVRVAHLEPSKAQDDWLVEDLWGWPAVGFIGGIPKSGKTFLALELAVAVASGKPALGRFLVHKPGKVLIYAAEDDATAIRSRVQGLCQARRLDFDDLRVGLIREPGLRLDQEDHRERLAMTLQRVRPRLLILDPLVRLHRADENSSAEISELLGYLRELQRAFEVAILLVHHVRKSPAGQPGQALRGSGDLHAWTDSALYLLRRKGELMLHAEHRAHPAPEPVPICLRADPAHLELTEEPGPSSHDTELEERVLELVQTRPVSRSRLRAMLKIRNERLGVVVQRLLAGGRLVRRDGLLGLPVPTHRDQPERNGEAAADHHASTPPISPAAPQDNGELFPRRAGRG